MRRKLMYGSKQTPGFVLCAPALALLTVLSSAPAEAHHAMGGGRPATFFEGLLSGLGHPVIGLDHLAFLVAIGVAVGVSGLNLVIPALFIAASALGVALHVSGMALPGAELLVALSVLLAGTAIALGRSAQGPARSGLWAALFSVAGLVHGYAFGESIFGAEASPLAAYLIGLVVVQTAVATGVALIARRSGAAAVEPRLAGAAIAGIGLAILAGQILPA
jgi:urease accessory protein